MTLRILYSLHDLSLHCGVRSERILSFVSKEWLKPVDSERLIFDEEDLARTRLIHDLQIIMGVNDDAVPIILHLVDQINRMHLEIKERL